MALALGPTAPARAAERVFEPGSLIIPMDTTYQDHGMFKAFGLVYALLRADVPVAWVIKPSKSHGDADFVTNARDRKTNEAIVGHGYRAGPFVVEAAHAATALPIVDLWQSRHVTAVHVAEAAFTGFVARTLVVAPSIAVFSDGNEDIAFGYLNAAGIPDSRGQGWPTRKAASYPNHPDALTVPMLAGPTTTNHADGALFDEEGNPVYCQIMTMHWNVSDVVDEVVAEIRSFLEHPTHLFAECQAVNALENNVHGRFLTATGFLIAPRPAAVSFLNADYPFAQMDGPFGIVGGSEPAYSLPAGAVYKDADIVMVTGANTPVGVQDVWMTGYLDGRCSMGSAYEIPGSGGGGGSAPGCRRGLGKVSYLGGHKYETRLPISRNPNSQGTRLFLNSIFEADCAAGEGQPYVNLHLHGPTSSADGTASYQIELNNFGPGPVLDVVIVDTLPPGASLLFATSPHAESTAQGTVTWAVGNVSAGAQVALELEIAFAGPGVWENRATALYGVGLNRIELEAEPVVTRYSLTDPDGDGCPEEIELTQGTDPTIFDTDEDGFGDCDDLCPVHPNPPQDLDEDPEHCGACGHACVLANAIAACHGGECVIAACADGFTNADGRVETGCEATCEPIDDEDTTCNGVDDDCDGLVDDDVAVERCGVGACESFSACVGGEIVACVPGAAGVEGAGRPETCENGRDDDCDGLADDEDPACGGMACEGDGDCDDGDPCTAGRCEAARCTFEGVCGPGPGEDVGPDPVEGIEGAEAVEMVGRDDASEGTETAEAGPVDEGRADTAESIASETVAEPGAPDSGAELDGEDRQVMGGGSAGCGCEGGGAGAGMPWLLAGLVLVLRSRRGAVRG